MKNFLKREPNNGKNWAQQPPRSQLPQHSPQSQPGGIAQANVPLANSKAQIQPRGAQCTDKNQICQRGQPGAQRTQEAVDQPQAAPHQQGHAEPGGCQ